MDNAITQRGWYDVKDTQGNWRLGKQVGVISGDLIQIRLQGWSFKYDSVYCIHSQNLAPPRSHSQGYTTQQPFPLRQLLTDEHYNQFQSLKVKLNLFVNSDLMTMNLTDLNLFFRVELFTMFDTILTLPFNHLDIKQSIPLTKFFINIVNLALKVLQDSAVYLPTVKSNPHHEALHKASYQIFLMLRGVLGLNNRYKKFFDHPDNQFNKMANTVSLLLDSEQGGLLHFNTYLKTMASNNLNSQQDFIRANQIMSILLQLYEKKLIREQYTTHLKMIVDTMANYIKSLTKTQQIFKYLTQNSSGKYLINMFENMHMKLKPEKKFIQLKEMKDKQDKRDKKIAIPDLQHVPSSMKSDIDDKKLLALQQRLNKLQTQVAKNKVLPPKSSNAAEDLLNKLFTQKQKQLKKKQFMDVTISGEYDFNQISFLNALQLHLMNNQTEKANKLIQWRKKILQVSVLAGWDVARTVAKKTQNKLQIQTQDILMSNLDYLKNTYSL